MGSCRKVLKRNALTIATISAFVLGIVIGVVIRETNPELTPEHNTPYGLSIPGELLLRALNLVVIPLVSTSLILGIVNGSGNSFNSKAFYTVVYYLGTTLIAVSLGLAVVLILTPGAGGPTGDKVALNSDYDRKTDLLDIVKDTLNNFVPDNIVGMALQRTTTRNSEEGRLVKTHDGMNMLGIISVSIAVGIIVSKQKERCAVFIEFVTAVNYIVNKMVRVVLWYAPIGIMFLVISELAGNGLKKSKELMMYIATVLVGLSLHFFIVLPSILGSLGRRNPFKFYKNLLPAMATAFGTASSTVTIPMTLKCTQRAGVSQRITDFVVPIGATINMDGTALYEAVACIFVAQLNGVELTKPEVIITGITATIAAIGAAGIPSAGIITLIMVLNSVGLSTENVAMLLAVDWFIDRFRTMVNVVGDSVGCAVIQRICGDDGDLVESPDHDIQFEPIKNTEDDDVKDPEVVGA